MISIEMLVQLCSINANTYRITNPRLLIYFTEFGNTVCTKKRCASEFGSTRKNTSGPIQTRIHACQYGHQSQCHPAMLSGENMDLS